MVGSCPVNETTPQRHYDVPRKLHLCGPNCGEPFDVVLTVMLTSDFRHTSRLQPHWNVTATLPRHQSLRHEHRQTNGAEFTFYIFCQYKNLMRNRTVTKTLLCMWFKKQICFELITAALYIAYLTNTGVLNHSTQNHEYWRKRWDGNIFRAGRNLNGMQ